MSISFSGSSLLNGTGIDVTNTVSQLIAVERAPEQVWQQQESTYQSQSSVLKQLSSQASAMLDSINSLKDGIGGSLAKYTATSSNTAAVSASTGVGAAIGTHSIVVSQLASTGAWYGATPVATSTTTLGAGSFTLQVGSGTAATVTIDSTNNTLDSLAQSINSQNLGVTASVVTDTTGARLALVSQKSGAASNITITNDNSGLGLTKAYDGVNATLTVDGVPIESDTNSVSTAVPGVTFSLNQASPTAVQVSLGPDTQGASQAISDFVSAYNTLITNINSQFQFNTATQQAGTLAGNGTIRDAQQQLLQDMSFVMGGSNGGFETLRSMGISMKDDGTLSVDSTALTNAISSNYAAVQNLFQSADGFGTNVAAHLKSLTDSTQGTLTLALQGMDSNIKTVEGQISDFEVYIANKQQQLTAQYNQINVLLQQLPLQLETVRAQVGSLLPSNNNSNS